MGKSGRGSGSPGVFSRKGISSKPTAPATTASAPASRAPAPVTRQTAAPTPVANKTALAKPNSPASPATTTGAPVAPASGPSFLGNVASSALGSFTGVMIADSLFGGKEAQQQQQMQNGEYIQPTAVAQNQLNYPGNTKCQAQFFSFMKCVESNNSSISSCQWAYDMFKSCNVSQLD